MDKVELRRDGLFQGTAVAAVATEEFSGADSINELPATGWKKRLKAHHIAVSQQSQNG
jgi:hypothetical protein